MRAVLVRDGKCVVSDVPEPVCGPDDVVITVKATAVNRLDVLQRKGIAKVPAGVTEVLGLEVSGVVAEIGADCGKPLAVGQAVCALVSGGAFAERVAVNWQSVLAKPERLSFEAAAAVPETWLTAYQLLCVVGEMQSGDAVLVHAAASGVGVAAVQLAAKFGGSVVATASSQRKIDAASRLGAAAGVVVARDAATGAPTAPWAAAAREANGGRGFDLVLDCVAGSYAADNVEALAVDGRWVLYALLGGQLKDDALAGSLFGKLLAKRVSLRATTLRGRSVRRAASAIIIIFSRGADEMHRTMGISLTINHRTQ